MRRSLLAVTMLAAIGVSVVFASQARAQALNPVWWGADPTGTNDSAAAINKAVAAATLSAPLSTSPGKEIHISFPPGVFKINSQIIVTLTASLGGIRIDGAGPLLTTLYFPNATSGLDIDLGTDPAASAHVRDLSMVTGQMGTSNGLALQSETSAGPAYVNGLSDITNVDFFGYTGYGQGDFWLNAIVLLGMSNVSLQNINIYGGGADCTKMLSPPCGIGIYVQKNNSTLANVINVSSSDFYYLTNGIDGVGDVESLTVQQSSFLGNSIGILASGSPGALQWNIGPSNNFTDVFQDIKITNEVNDLTVNNNLLLITINGEIGIDIAATANGGAILQGNYIACNPGTSSTEGIYIGASQTSPFTAPSVVNGNVIQSCTTGILADTNSNLINIGNNGFSAITPPAIINNGIHNVIANNLGYNPIGATAAANVGTSPATVCAGASPETHYLNQSATNTATVTEGSQPIATLANASTYYPVNLGPNECYVVTWATTQPTYTKYVH